MSDSEELNRLADLHQRGALSDEEFARAKARVLEGGSSSGAGGFAQGAALNRLRRSRDDRWLGGVCGGLARFTGLESWALRLLFALALLCAGTGALIYLLMWIFVPQD
ncbi:PspC domain-containing protein [Roseateles sp. DAIF2]|uniref:PspC domain-containing protein n=1 Tax=Roseateles sp. DAIF2 TaxID=2714952 RepID=UPI0018A2FD25|nr:PspC domain-containing protein [Roseateles sp. DAIF2]QPF71639.1 PspC domain-containing protein [Roseateles sp. DAIF2]